MSHAHVYGCGSLAGGVKTVVASAEGSSVFLRYHIAECCQTPAEILSSHMPMSYNIHCNAVYHTTAITNMIVTVRGCCIYLSLSAPEKGVPYEIITNVDFDEWKCLQLMTKKS